MFPVLYPATRWIIPVGSTPLAMKERKSGRFGPGAHVFVAIV